MARTPFSVPDAAKEIAYTAVGLGVLGFQRLQVRRRELERAARPVIRAASDLLPCATRSRSTGAPGSQAPGY